MIILDDIERTKIFELMDNYSSTNYMKSRDIYLNLGHKIENDTVLEMLPEDDCFIPTTKEDKQNHGLGMKRVKKTVEKYNGIYNNSIKGGKFVVNVVI